LKALEIKIEETKGNLLEKEESLEELKTMIDRTLIPTLTLILTLTLIGVASEVSSEI